MPDVIIIGAGPSGSSAAWVCSAAGLDTLLVTSSLDTVFHSFGSELRLSGDESAFAAAVLKDAGKQGRPRELQGRAKWLLEQQPGLHLLQASVSEILTEGSAVSGVETWEGPAFQAPLVAVCAGSFLAARLQQGSLVESAGKPSQMSYPELAESIASLGVELETASREFDGPAGRGSVSSKVITAGQLENGVWVERISGLAAAGYCVEPEQDFADALRAGQRLGEELTAQAPAVSSTGRT